jgi:two-component system nitrogen regulation response regulator NtrX
VSKKTVLLVDDEKKALILLSGILEDQGFVAEASTSADEAISIIKDESFDAIILDLKMPGKDGLQALSEIKQINPHIPVIMLSGHGNIEKAVKAVKMGAYDFLEKPVSSQKVIITLNNAITMSGLKMEKGFLLKEMQNNLQIVGESQTMKKIFQKLDKIAISDSAVLITGESGTGKELVARAIHLKSGRAAKPFIPINCSAIPRDLIESELFGYEKGAFTGALREKPGLFEQAEGGTLFLDEISEMSRDLQPKLLRVVESGQIQRVGGTKMNRIDVRILSASNIDVKEALAKRILREDLFYRLSVLTVNMPPLRERKEDIPQLIQFFSKQFCKQRKRPEVFFPPDSLKILISYSWPGNIRELKNLVEKIVVLTDSREILPEIVKEFLGEEHHRGDVDLSKIEQTLQETRLFAERDKLLASLNSFNWDYKKTAEDLDISRATLFNKMKKYEISGKRKKNKFLLF